MKVIHEFVFAYYPSVPGSNLKHSIYAFSFIAYCAIFVSVLRKG